MQIRSSKWVLLGILSLIWGSSFILIHKGLEGLTPYELGSLRIVFASVFLLIIGHKTLKQIKPLQWKYIVLTAFCGTFFPAYLFAVAQTQISSTISAILNSLTPLFTLILGSLIFAVHFQKRQIWGVIIGFIGCSVLILNGAANHPDQNYLYTILVIIASLFYAMNVNLIKRHLSDLPPLAITTGNFIVLVIPALIILSSIDFFPKIEIYKVQSAMYFIAILGIVGTGIANIIFFRLIQISSPVFASSVTYLIPVVAFFWGMVYNEMLTPIQFLGAFVVLIGVYLSAKK